MFRSFGLVSRRHGSRWPFSPAQLAVLLIAASTVYGCGRTGSVGVSAEVIHEVDCNNSIDDDVDGLTDCADPDCAADSFCVAGGENCGNNRDDDGDGRIDCDDPDCVGHPLCGEPPPEDCGNGEDDDVDGLTDCADPDCRADPRCLSGTEDCDNGRDDDDDEAIDCEDPDCADDVACIAGDENCGNNIDDDGDGDIDCDDRDCELHPLCEDRGDEDCVNGVDDDLDGRVDCLDPDCSGHPACGILEENCSNGRDDDEDGAVDCDDEECRDDPFCADRPEICTNRRDDDRDALVDCADPDCFIHPACLVQPGREICNNGIDDDEDGRIDCADPDCRALPICARPGNEICDNALDDDEDGAVDCADPDCFDSPACVDRVCRPSVDFGRIAARGSTSTRMLDNRGRVDEFDSPCAVPGGGEIVARFALSATADLRIDYEQLGGDHVLSLFRAGIGQVCNANPVQCFDPQSKSSGSFSASALLAGDYYLFAEAFSAGLEGQVRVTLSTGSDATREVCNNGVDDDEDGAVDCADLDCLLAPECESLQCRFDENVGTLVIDGPPRAVTLNTATGDNQIEESCAAGGGRDRVVRLVMPEAGGIAVQVRQRGWHVYGLHRDQGPGTTCLAHRASCFDSSDRSRFTVAYDSVDKGVYYYGVDALEPGQEGQVQLSFSAYSNRGPELCSNNIDDDGDGMVDCLDLDCIGVVGCQGPVCIPNHRTGTLVPDGDPALIDIDTRDANDNQTLSCALGGGKDEVVEIDLAQVSGLRVLCDQTGDHVLGLFAAGGPRDACDSNPQNCADPTTGPISCNFVFPNLQPGKYFLVAEAFRAGSEGTMRLQLRAVTDHAQEICDNGVDDDSDGLTDCKDPNCAGKPACEQQRCVPDRAVGVLQKDGPAKSAAVQTDDDEDDDFATPCAEAAGGAEQVVSFSLAERAEVQLDFLQFGNHTFALYRDRGSEFPCDTVPVSCERSGGVSVGSLRFEDLDAGDYHLVVEATTPTDGGSASVKLAAK